ncbi:hypothetical protein EDC01DRAFT_619586 [Geopyxis carbonaria]|nr:hypothetical protein EDC01DRAFT_619586 [Geopyxis carbonaria]
MNIVPHDPHVSPQPFLTFTFRARTPPPFSFPPARTQYPTPESSETTYPRKRARPLADIDGLDTDLREYSKKRRIRLKLITSRLSEPFAVPPTNIQDRANCPRGCMWARSRNVARNALRKAAILNKIRRDTMAAREAQQKQVEISRRQFRERLAAGAQSSFDSSNVIALKNQKAAQMQQPVARRPKGMQKRMTRSATAMAHDEQNLIIEKEQEEKEKDPYYIPSHRRPPSPPSEAELEIERNRRGMGLQIGLDVN